MGVAGLLILIINMLVGGRGRFSPYAHPYTYTFSYAGFLRCALSAAQAKPRAKQYVREDDSKTKIILDCVWCLAMSRTSRRNI